MSRDDVTLSSEEIKPVALFIVELCLAEGIVNSKFHYKLLEGFKVNLKTFLGLATHTA